MQTGSYKKRTADVRRQARATLIEMRRARLAKKSGENVNRADTVLPSQEIDADKIDLSAALETPSYARQTPEMPQIDRLADDMNEVAMQNAGVYGGRDDAGALIDVWDVVDLPVTVTEMTQVDLPANEIKTVAMDNAASCGGDQDAAATDIVHLGAHDETEGSDTPMVDTDDSNDSDLYELPGAGPGLVWLLGQCGVFTLSELAQADPARLTTGLGVIGQIVDVGAWIAFAKENALG